MVVANSICVGYTVPLMHIRTFLVSYLAVPSLTDMYIPIRGRLLKGVDTSK